MRRTFLVVVLDSIALGLLVSTSFNCAAPILSHEEYAEKIGEIGDFGRVKIIADHEMPVDREIESQIPGTRALGQTFETERKGGPAEVEPATMSTEPNKHQPQTTIPVTIKAKLTKGQIEFSSNSAIKRPVAIYNKHSDQTILLNVNPGKTTVHELSQVEWTEAQTLHLYHLDHTVNGLSQWIDQQEKTKSAGNLIKHLQPN